VSLCVFRAPLRAERERSTQNANVVIPAQIAKQKAIIDAQARS
jgi:flotillin